MKKRITLSVLGILSLYSASCLEDNKGSQVNPKVEVQSEAISVRSVTYTSPSGESSLFYLDDGDGKMSWARNGQEIHTEVKELSIEKGESSYVINADRKTIYVPKSYLFEVINLPNH